MPNLGPMELVLILGVALLLFGGRKLPELAKGMGEGIKNFKNALREDPPILIDSRAPGTTAIGLLRDHPLRAL